MKFIKGKYSRAELEKTRKLKANDPKLRGIVEDLIKRAGNGDKMSSAEKDYALGVVKTTYNAETNERLNVDDFPILADFLFKDIYILYHEDLEGKHAIYDLFGVISVEEKVKDVARLNKFYADWEIIVLKLNHSEELQNEVAAETRKELKQLNEFAEKENLDYREVAQKKKSIVLHSKFLYLTVKEFFEENDAKPVIANYNGKEIEINTYSLTHIMFRHYAGVVKQFDTNKSFHFDTGIHYKTLPLELKWILEKISASQALINESSAYIPFRYRGNPYAIWTKEAKKSIKGKHVKFNRLQTYYPILDEEEWTKIETERVEIRIDHDLSVFRKK